MENPANAGFWLSPQQRNICSLQQGSGVCRSVALVSIEGRVSVDGLRRSLNQVVLRHEILRTIYRRQPGMTFPFQVVLDAAEPAIEIIDLSSLIEADCEARVRELFFAARVPDVVAETAPVLRAQLVMLGADRHAAIFSLPALAADRRALQVLVREIGHFAAGKTPEGEEEPLRYVQYAQWQNDLVDGEDENAAKGRDFWKSRADAAPAMALPGEIDSGDGFLLQTVAASVNDATRSKVESFAASVNASVSDVLLAAWQSLLWRLTGHFMFKVGTVFDGREYEELQDAVGVIEKTIPIDARFDGDFRFREVVEHVRSSIAGAAGWQEYYVPGSGFGVEAPISFQYVEEAALGGTGGLSIALRQTFASTDRFKLRLSAVQSTGAMVLEFDYDASRLPHDSAQLIAEYFRNLLAAAVADPESPVSLLPLMSQPERQKLVVEWNQTAANYPRDKCLHQLFEAQAARTPERPALRFNDEVLTYRELNEQANQMAHLLRSLGVGPDALVGLCVERSARLMVALLGIMKAGGAYVPLNPDNPKPRLAQQLTGAAALITEQKLLSHMPAFAGTIVGVDRDRNLWADQPRTNPENETKPENLVYVIYTSGSTGVPKGVAVRHSNLVNYSHFITRRLQLDGYPDGLHFGTVSTIGADLGNTCIYPALISGGCLHVMSYEVATDAHSFAAYTGEYPLDVLKIVPSHLQALLHSPEAKFVLPRRYLVLGGETLTPKLVEEIEDLGSSCEFLNHYGPTETTVGSLTLRLAEYDWKGSTAISIPIGRPIANTQVYILDARLQPVPIGVVGELYVAGEGVAAGYLNQPERTAERFVVNPFADDPNARMYRTGDVARYLPDGNVEFLGRGDDQVKIRGFRIELGEIESVLVRRAGVKQAVVLAKEDDRSDKRLLAYVVVDREQNISVDDLRAHLKERLPEFMVPSAIVLLPKIPLNANGKVDRMALPEPEALETKIYIAPSNSTEEGVAKIWGEVLRRDRISTDDNFFELGGHSLLATQIVSRVREQFRVDLPIRAMFENPTICGLAEAITTAGKCSTEIQDSPIVRVSRDVYRSNRT